MTWNEAMVEKYDPEAYHLHSSLPIRLIEKMRVRAVLEAVQSPPASSILEIGCGAGNVVEHLREAKCFGVDLSFRMVARSRERLKNRISVLQADGQRLPFSSNTFDGVLCTEVLEHVENPELVLDEIHRVAKPQARIALSIPNENLINRLKRWIFRLKINRFLSGGQYQIPEQMNDEWHLHVFDLKDLTQMLTRKFLIKKIKPIPFAVLPLRYVIACTPR
mgnify:CR=1 FL=1